MVNHATTFWSRYRFHPNLAYILTLHQSIDLQNIKWIVNSNAELWVFKVFHFYLLFSLMWRDIAFFAYPNIWRHNYFCNLYNKMKIQWRIRYTCTYVHVTFQEDPFTQYWDIDLQSTGGFFLLTRYNPLFLSLSLSPVWQCASLSLFLSI